MQTSMIVTRSGLPRRALEARSSSFGFGEPWGRRPPDIRCFAEVARDTVRGQGEPRRRGSRINSRRVWRADVTTLISRPSTARTARFQQIIHLYWAKRRTPRSAPMLKSGSFRRFRGRKGSIAEAVLEVGARLDYSPPALLQISPHLLRSRIWGLFRRDIAHDHLKLRMTFHKLIDRLSKAMVFCGSGLSHGRFLLRCWT
jgi:hypothetical protein